MRPRLRGWSKIRRIVCFPGCAACQPVPRFGISADSIGCSALSEVISTLANRSRSNQASPERETDSEAEPIICLHIRHPTFKIDSDRTNLNSDAHQICRYRRRQEFKGNFPRGSRCLYVGLSMALSQVVRKRVQSVF